MMYGSYDGSRTTLASNFPQGAVMVGYEGTGKKKTLTKRVYQGSQEPQRVARVSEGDVARIAQLYPVGKNGKAVVPTVVWKDGWKEVAGEIPMKPQAKDWKNPFKKGERN